MKHLIKLIALATIALFTLAACSAFVFTTSDLKGKTLTYYFNMMTQTANGHDYTTLTFDSTGAAGSFATYGYSWNYPTQAAYVAGDYTGKEWFQTVGAQGTFTYNADSGAVSMSLTQMYSPTATSTQIGTTGLYDAYEWLTMDEYADLMSGGAISNLAMSQSSVVKITADNINVVYAAGTTVDTWVNTMTQTQSYVATGTTYSITGTTTDTYTIPSAGGSMTEEYKEVTDYSGPTTASETYIETVNLVVNKAFMVGKDDPANAAFADVWKKGNTVTFMADRTSYTEKYWNTDDPLPAAPTIGADGTGLTEGAIDSYYYANNNVGGATITFSNYGTYMLSAGDMDFAARHVKPFSLKK